jgi:hypothetical protein
LLTATPRWASSPSTPRQALNPQGRWSIQLPLAAERISEFASGSFRKSFFDVEINKVRCQ